MQAAYFRSDWYQENRYDLLQTSFGDEVKRMVVARVENTAAERIKGDKREVTKKIKEFENAAPERVKVRRNAAKGIADTSWLVDAKKCFSGSIVLITQWFSLNLTYKSF